MVVDTGTVRLVIFIGMFLVFAGDYTTLINKVFGNGMVSNNSTFGTLQGPPKHNTEKISLMAATKEIDSNDVLSRKAKMMMTIKTACLPKLICELTSSPHQDQLSEMEKSLLNLIRDTSLTTMAEVASRYHFAAHIGQLINGIEGQGCHNFYPTCPLPRSSVLNMMKKIRLR
ncbi:hypothetical protein HCN44_010060 [Aphidius gifuensis]|uniref:Uncharacterized protein n=1 Tax=Aphidius gifuensis TaxID=684658 RepID=A0A834XU17_APHGI|nr:uncharacterized protein LOC122851635 [Aphidius gifuensis]XP_044006931.1 uncharacterized protein LOC122851635 [Aphidius gifuensis]KAF7993465.1 hypothetical protein HCN44_010060 [Aphidius gifuensis]